VTHAIATSGTTKLRAGPGAIRRLLLLLVLPAAIFTGVFVYTLHERESTAEASQNGALVWSDGGVIFASTDEIAAWIRQHGGDFQTFKRNHPAAVKLVKAQGPGGSTASSASTPRIAPVVLGVVAALLLILTFMPAPLLRRLRRLRGPNLRLATGAAAVAIAAALALALTV
jgi:hypothetical protein